ncbi:ABC transporter permease [Candidatus Margulisiibacteriota bacterium]
MWLFRLGFRNVLRNKGRNILLGTAIAFGMMILVISNSFSHGISDTLINKIIIYISGHMDFVFVEKGKVRSPIIREKERFVTLIRENVTGIRDLTENLSIFGRVVGNGKSDNLALIGLDVNDADDLGDYFKVIKGDINSIFDKKFINPVIIAVSKAEYLNVKVLDSLRARLQNVHGQHQTGILTVVAIVKSRNMFMDMAVFVDNKNIKKLMGLRPYESGSLQIILEDPETAIAQAEKLHAIAKPGTAAIHGTISKNTRKEPVTVLGFYRDSKSLAVVTRNIRTVKGTIKAGIASDGVMLHELLAKKLKVGVGEKINLKYQNKYEDKYTQRQYKIKSIFRTKPDILPAHTLLLSDKLFYKTYYSNLPVNAVYQNKLSGFNVIAPAIGEEWKLLPRSTNFDEFKKKFKEFSRSKAQVAALDVRTMHESASNILKLEKVLNLITLLAVLVMFFIILIGVINSLRMTIRERTREIGTVRAIGMRKKDVRRLIVIETLILSFFAGVAGIVLGFIVMGLSHFLIIKTVGMLSILIVNNRLHFVPNVNSIAINMVLILVIAVCTAYFPAKHAANLSAAEALRHYE